MRLINSEKGSLTLEAAIVMPIFICAVISVAFIIKLVYVQQLMQHALHETADEMAAYAYIYHASGIKDAHEGIYDGIDDEAQLLKNQMDTIVDSVNGLHSLPDKAGPRLEDIAEAARNRDLDELIKELEDGGSLVGNAGNEINALKGVLEDIAANPGKEIKSFAFLLGGQAFRELEDKGIFIPITRYYMKKHLRNSDGLNENERLKSLHVVKGFSGLDFGDSDYFENGRDEIDLIVKYHVDLPLPIKVLPKLLLVQRAAVRTWTDGDGTSEKDAEEYIWEEDNFKRADYIRKAFGGYLPTSYGIARFDKEEGNQGVGTVVAIHSVNVTSKANSTLNGLSKTLIDHIDKMVSFQGLDYEKFKITPSQIKAKKVIIVIPKETANSVTNEAFQKAEEYAKDKGVLLEIKEFGYLKK